VTAIRQAAATPHPCYVWDATEEISGSRALEFSDRVDRSYRTLNLEPDEDQRLLCRIGTEHTGRILLDTNQDAAYRSCGFAGPHLCAHDANADALYPARAEKRVRESAGQLLWEAMDSPFTFILTECVPMLTDRGVSDEDLETIFVDDPSQLLAGSAP
jgi:hypothetical protein